jgi:hypothetical protein
VRAGTGSRADGWAAPLTVYFGPTTILQRQAAIDRAAIDAGRRPADIRRMYGVLGRIAAEHSGTLIPSIVARPSTWG